MTFQNQIIETIQRRARPEDVADLVTQALAGSPRPLDRRAQGLFDRVARLSFRQQASNYSLMLDDFHRPVGMERNAKVASTLFVDAPPLMAADCSNPGRMMEFIQVVGPQIHKVFGVSDFKHNRMNRQERKDAGLGQLSRRGYNKRFRLLIRMEDKLTRLAREVQKYDITKISKTGLATFMPPEELGDLDTACFVAYYAARCNVRSLFTAGAQARPYDQICEVLFNRLLDNDTTNWWAVALIHPVQEVLVHLSDDQKGKLLGRWYRILQDIASILEQAWSRSNIDKTTMIVRRGNDSSTWNVTAGAWNQARHAWIELVHALGMSELLDDICLGKVLRLMAADVAYMHKTYGSGGLEPDTAVWNDLPLPWEVLRGETVCTRMHVMDVCVKHGVDAQAKGWIAPRPKHVAEFTPTPELVHGIVVTNPDLALQLRKGKAFSGKNIRWDQVPDRPIVKERQGDVMIVTS